MFATLPTTAPLFTDYALARRLELAEAENAAGFGRVYGARHGREPEVLSIAGGQAVFAGASSPLTHAVGIGMLGPVTAADFDALESFYRERGAAANVDLCPHADPSLLDQLGRRGYRISELNNVLVRRIEPATVAAPGIRPAEPGEKELWARTVMEGFFGRDQITPEEFELGTLLFDLPGAVPWFVFEERTPAAAGALFIRHRLATLFGDSTLPLFRKRGLHSALIQTRIAYAAENGCDLATASALPGSISACNYERLGFRVAYTKTVTVREF